MNTQHKALELAEHLSQYRGFPEDREAADLIVEQHALIKQIREAIKLHKECEFTSDHPTLSFALATAEKYLGELG